jgi:hypothetical protein
MMRRVLALLLLLSCSRASAHPFEHCRWAGDPPRIYCMV